MPLTYRELRPFEFDLIPPEATAGLRLPDNSRVFAAFDSSTGEIAAIVGVLAVAHIEPLWIREESRKSPFLIRRLWERVLSALQECDLRRILVVTVPETERIAKFCGGVERPNRLFTIDIPPAQNPSRLEVS